MRPEPDQFPADLPAGDRAGAAGLSEPPADLHGESGAADWELFGFGGGGAVWFPVAVEFQPAVPEVGELVAARRTETGGRPPRCF